MIDYTKISDATMEMLTAWIALGRPMGQFAAAISIRGDGVFETARLAARSRAADCVHVRLCSEWRCYSC
jgi:hypothetical protein